MDFYCENELIEITQSIIRHGINFQNDCIKIRDLKEFIKLADKHYLLEPLTYFLLNSGMKNKLLLENQKLVDKKIALYIKELKEISFVFQENKIEFCVIKGMPLSQIIYGKPNFRRIGDIDIIINEKQIDKAFYLMKAMGYEQRYLEGYSDPIYNYSLHFHEIQMYKIIENQLVAVEIKRRSSAVGANNKDWFNELQEIKLEGLDLFTQNNIFSLLHMFANTFIKNEGKHIFMSNRLREYFDIAYFIQNKDVDWQLLLNEAQKLEITHQIHEVLLSISQIYDIDRINLNDILSQTSKEYCNYKLTLVSSEDDENTEFNSGLLAYHKKSNSRISIFNRDFKFYENCRIYKAVVYSNYFTEYNCRLKIPKNTSSEWISYEYSGYKMMYQYQNFESFNILLKFDQKDFESDEFKNVIAKIEWVDNDINAITKSFKVETTPITNLSVNSIFKMKRRDEYFEKTEYYQDYSYIENNYVVEVAKYFCESSYYISIKFDKRSICRGSNIIALETKLGIRNKTEITNISNHMEVIELI